MKLDFFYNREVHLEKAKVKQKLFETGKDLLLISYCFDLVLILKLLEAPDVSDPKYLVFAVALLCVAFLLNLPEVSGYLFSGKLVKPKLMFFISIPIVLMIFTQFQQDFQVSNWLDLALLALAYLISILAVVRKLQLWINNKGKIDLLTIYSYLPLIVCLLARIAAFTALLAGGSGSTYLLIICGALMTHVTSSSRTYS